MHADPLPSAGLFLSLLYDDDGADAQLALDALGVARAEPEDDVESDLLLNVELPEEEEDPELAFAQTLSTAGGGAGSSEPDSEPSEALTNAQSAGSWSRATVEAAAAAASAARAKTRVLTKKELRAKNPLKQKANKARDERRSELIYLRQKVAELEERLGAIHSKRPRLVGSSDAAAAGCEDGGDLVVASPRRQSLLQHQGLQLQRVSLMPSVEQPPYVVNAWQDIATRQSEERVKAERENIRLKLVLENQLKIAKSLERILNKRSTAKDIEEFAERSHACAPLGDTTDEEVFERLRADVQQLYFEVDAVFEANGLAQTEAPLTNAHVRSDAENGMVLEMFANKVLPFDMHATGSAVWHHFAFAKEHTPFRNYKFSSSRYLRSEDTVVENFVLKLDAKGTNANFRVKQILRRHVEDDRIVILWRTAFEAFEFSNEPVSGMRFRESGYIVIKRPSSIPGDHSLLQTCYIMTPDFAEEVAGSSHPRVGSITDFVLASTAANISSTHQMIENVLLEQAVKQRSSLGMLDMLAFGE